MRILTYTRLYPNAKMPEHGIFVARRVEAMARQGGHQIEVVAPVPYYPKFLPASGEWNALKLVPEVEERDGLNVYHPRYFNPPKIGMAKYGAWMAQGSYDLLYRLRKSDFQFEVIDAHFVYPDGYAAVKLGQRLKRPVIVTARGSDLTRNKNLPHIVPLLQEVLRGAAQLIAVSEELRDNFLELGATPDKIHVIPNGVDTSFFTPMTREAARRALHLKADDCGLVAVARLDRNKGQWLILEALKKIGLDELKNRRIKVALVGQGESRAELEKIAQAAGLGDIVHFAGQQNPEKIRIWYNAANVNILASSREGSPNVVLEALACGTPVIASLAGNNATIIHAGSNGFVFPIENAEALKIALLLALDHHWDRQAIAATGSQRNWAAVAREVESVLDLTIHRTR